MSKIIPDILEVVPGTLKDYHKLAEYHYLPKRLRLVSNVFKIKARYPYHKSFPDPIGVNVYKMPIPELRSRSAATNGYFRTPATKSERMKLVNSNIRYAARLIIDPRFRKMGVATKLVKESMEQMNIPIIETLTPIDFTNEMLVKLGFELYYTPAPTWYRPFVQTLRALGLTPDYMLLPSTLTRRIQRLKGERRENTEHQIQSFLHQFKRRQFMPAGIERARFILSKIPFPEAYLIWFNPKIKLPKTRRIKGVPSGTLERTSSRSNIPQTCCRLAADLLQNKRKIAAAAIQP
ncbi:hypothetical protein ES703_26300 [subsurface metagenome]